MKHKRRFVFIICSTIAVIGMVVNFLLLLNSFLFNKKIAVSSVHNVQNPYRRVLYINSYDFGRLRVPMQIEGLSSVFREKSINMDILYMDAANFDEEAIHEYFYTNLKHIIATRPAYDAVLFSDEEALKFLEEFYDDFFSQIPVVFFSVSDSVRARSLAKKENVTGFVEKIFFDDTLDVAKRIIPLADKLVVIYDDTQSGFDWWTQVKSDRQNSNFKIKGINTSKYTDEELAGMLEAIDDKSIVVFMSATDNFYGNSFKPIQQIKRIIPYVHVPVFRYSLSGLSSGLLGGKVVDFSEAGKDAANAIVQIFENSETKKLPLQVHKKGIFYADLRALEKYNISQKVFPKATLFSNSNISKSARNVSMIKPIIGIIAYMLIFIIILCVTSIVQLKQRQALREANTEMNRMVYTDFLTQLPNRTKIHEVYKKLVKDKIEFSMILADIDDFKYINDYYSHSCGDVILRTIATRLQSLSETGLFVASRFSGDEFLIIYTGGFLNEDSPELQRLQHVFATPVLYENRKIFVNASIGIASSNSGLTEDDLISNADIALYQCKNSGKNKYCIYNEDLGKNRLHYAELKKEIEDAIERDKIEVFYQPQIDVETGNIFGFEALCRIKNNEISPADFIPVAEETGLIVKIDRIITAKVVQQLSEWRNKGIPLHKVSINYSYAQISDLTYAEYLQGLLNQYDIPSKYIGIEITESLFIGNKETEKNLFKKFSDMGISISLDDFGTGYSSLSYLTYLPVDIVKIDKSIVDNYLKSDHEAFVKNIVRLIHSLDMKLTVEGVEHTWQYNKLKAFHCDYIQGYVFGKPMNGYAVEKYVVPKLEENVL